MKKLMLILFKVALLSGVNAQKRNYTPLELAKLFMGPYGYTDMRTYMCCELLQEKDPLIDSLIKSLPEAEKKRLEESIPDYTKKTYGQTVPDSVIRKYELIQQDSGFAVVSIEFSFKTLSATNLYVYCRNINGWKVSSVRGLALSHLMQSKLAHSSDQEIIDYFTDRENSFTELLCELKKKEKSEKIDSLKKKLGLLSARKQEDISSNAYNFIVDGITDNLLGYLYIEDESKCPKISESAYIIIRRIKKGWFMYKTT